MYLYKHTPIQFNQKCLQVKTISSLIPDDGSLEPKSYSVDFTFQ